MSKKTYSQNERRKMNILPPKNSCHTCEKHLEMPFQNVGSLIQYIANKHYEIRLCFFYTCAMIKSQNNRVLINIFGKKIIENTF